MFNLKIISQFHNDYIVQNNITTAKDHGNEINIQSLYEYFVHANTHEKYDFDIPNC